MVVAEAEAAPLQVTLAARRWLLTQAMVVAQGEGGGVEAAHLPSLSQMVEGGGRRWPVAPPPTS